MELFTEFSRLRDKRLRKHANSHCFLSLPYYKRVKDRSGSKGTEGTDGNARVPDEGAQGRIWDPAAALFI